MSELTQEKINRRSEDASARYASMNGRDRDLQFSFELVGWIDACNRAGIPMPVSIARIMNLISLLEKRNPEHFTGVPLSPDPIRRAGEIDALARRELSPRREQDE